MREEPFKIKWAQEDVEVKIRNIRDPVSRRRTRAAFEYLMKKRNCSYKKFIMMHRNHVREPWAITRILYVTKPENMKENINLQMRSSCKLTIHVNVHIP